MNWVITRRIIILLTLLVLGMIVTAHTYAGFREYESIHAVSVYPCIAYGFLVVVAVYLFSRD